MRIGDQEIDVAPVRPRVVPERARVEDRQGTGEPALAQRHAGGGGRQVALHQKDVAPRDGVTGSVPRDRVEGPGAGRGGDDGVLAVLPDQDDRGVRRQRKAREMRREARFPADLGRQRRRLVAVDGGVEQNGGAGAGRRNGLVQALAAEPDGAVPGHQRFTGHGKPSTVSVVSRQRLPIT